MIALLARFPSRRTARQFWPVIPENERAAYPALADDFAVLDEVVAPPFRELDLAALDHQYRHRRQQVVVLLGSALLSGVAALEVAFPEQSFLGLVVAVLGVVLAWSSRLAEELKMLPAFLAARIRAEQLRSLHFQFLARTGPFAGSDRRTALELAVADVQAGKDRA